MLLSITPRKRPRQSRAQATVDAILEATAHILVDVGWDNLNTNEVARRAGVSVGSLYQYFSNKQSLLAELHYQHALQTSTPVFEVLKHSAGKTLKTVIRQIIKAQIASHLTEPKLHQVISEESAKLPKQPWQDAMQTEAASLVLSFLKEHINEVKAPINALTIYMLMQIVESTVHSAVMMAPQSLKDGSLERELGRMLLLYLTSPA